MRDRFASGRGQDSVRGLTWAGSIVPLILFGLLCVVPPAFGRMAVVGESTPRYIPNQHQRGDIVTAGRTSPVWDVETGAAMPLFLLRLATPTAVTSPTATIVSPSPTDTAVPQAPPAQPTNTAPPAVPGATGSPQATAPAIPTGTISLEPSLTPVATDTLTVSPTSDQGPAEATSPAPTSTPLTPSAMPIQDVTTTTAALEPKVEAPTTYTARVPLPTGSLLDRLTYNKPGIWGNKAFYVGLAVVYVVLLMLFFRLLFQLGRQSD